jgi:hypothetical protein
MTLTWEYWAADGRWRQLTPVVSADPDPQAPTRAFLENGTISLVAPAGWAVTTQGDGEIAGHWLRVTVVSADWTAPQPPTLRSLRVDYEWELPAIRGISLATEMAGADLRPDAAFASQLPIDLNLAFHPFGDRPRLNDALYLASAEGFAPPAKRVRLEVTVTNPANEEGTPPPARPSSDLTLAWEYWDGEAQRWRGLAVSDTTDRLRVDGEIAFELPAAADAVEVNAVRAHWIRARIAKGDYGRPASYTLIDVVATDATQPTVDKAAVVQPETFAPPVLSSLTIDYETTATDPRPFDRCICENDFELVDATERATRGVEALRPFTPVADDRPTLYLGFDSKLPDRAVSLYLAFDETAYAPGLTSGGAAGAGPPVVAWEYWNGERLRWTRLAPNDETRSFTQPGLVTFLGPPGHTPSRELGVEARWIRARWERGGYHVAPRVGAVLPNTTWAVNATTTENEVLGSGTNEPGQLMQLTGAPVLEDEVIEVREPGGVSAETWVAWTPVRDFYESGPHDRHYVIDRERGLVRFGDGQSGLAPPAGRDNVRAARYRHGGGVAGNRPAGAIAQLKSAVPYVQGVVNAEPARGGAAQESSDAVVDRGPKTLRHGGRAITTDDIEDLAFEASTEVARVLTLPAGPAGSEGSVGLVVVARVPGMRRPVPSLALLDLVENYVVGRATPTFDVWVAGPGWIDVAVTAEVVPRSVDEAAHAESEVLQALDDFLHPLTGGVLGTGWPFGRRPHRSDLIARVEAVPSVDHVRALTVATRTDQEPPAADATLVFSGAHSIAMVAGD